LQDVWPSPGLVHYIYTFRGYMEFRQLQNSLCVQVLRSPILAALLHGTRAAAVGQTLWRGTRNGITELSQMAPPIFGWAAITMGSGPHSSCCFVYCLLCVSLGGNELSRSARPAIIVHIPAEHCQCTECVKDPQLHAVIEYKMVRPRWATR